MKTARLRRIDATHQKTKFSLHLFGGLEPVHLGLPKTVLHTFCLLWTKGHPRASLHTWLRYYRHLPPQLLGSECSSVLHWMGLSVSSPRLRASTNLSRWRLSSGIKPRTSMVFSTIQPPDKVSIRNLPVGPLLVTGGVCALCPQDHQSPEATGQKFPPGNLRSANRTAPCRRVQRSPVGYRSRTGWLRDGACRR